jgi:tRNAThr (cytosine32-N3)-methyltransferase
MADTMVDPTTAAVTTNHQDVPLAKLTKGMEHMRPYVSVPTVTSPPPEEPSVYGVPSSLINPVRSKPATAVSSSNPEKRVDPFQFGSRLLEEGDDIFSFNAWDHVEVDDAFKEFAEMQYQAQRDAPVTDFDKARFNGAPEKFWNKFYTNNAANFFKDRKWLFQEFPALGAATKEDAGKVTILELGAGAGNTAFPILAANKNPELKLHACDFSAVAIDVIRKSELYDTKHIQADVFDVAELPENKEDEACYPAGLGKESVDIVILIFIFSALSPAQWTQALKNIYSVLKPGGQVLFRDYGRGDLAQVRFKKGRYLEENFYIRGDGTRVYFFEKEELEELFGGAESPSENTSTSHTSRPRFEIVNLGVDRRMLVNRQRKLKMYRCWMQGHFRKPAAA